MATPVSSQFYSANSDQPYYGLASRFCSRPPAIDDELQIGVRACRRETRAAARLQRYCSAARRAFDARTIRAGTSLLITDGDQPRLRLVALPFRSAELHAALMALLKFGYQKLQNFSPLGNTLAAAPGKRRWIFGTEWHGILLIPCILCVQCTPVSETEVLVLLAVQ